jgi:hypothetical protein
MQHTSHLTQEMQACINNCQQCHASCVQTLNHCLQMGGKHAEYNHVRLLQDCIQICQTSADFMLRTSPLHTYTCSVCAEVCERCADDCSRLGANDQMMRQCAELCRTCAQSCRKMSDVQA